jgi:CrcB protein
MNCFVSRETYSMEVCMVKGLAVFLGGGVGAFCRWGVAGVVQRVLAGGRWEGFPAGTLVVNSAGACVIGLCFSLFERVAAPVELRLLVITGFLGGFTTFSSYSLESVRLLQAGHWGSALFNVLANNGLCLCFAALGLWLGRKMAV